MENSGAEANSGKKGSRLSNGSCDTPSLTLLPGFRPYPRGRFSFPVTKWPPRSLGMHTSRRSEKWSVCLVQSGVPTEISDRASWSIWGVPGQCPQSLSVRRKCSHVIGQTSVVRGSLESETGKATPRGPRQRAGGAFPKW